MLCGRRGHARIVNFPSRHVLSGPKEGTTSSYPRPCLNRRIDNSYRSGGVIQTRRPSLEAYLEAYDVSFLVNAPSLVSTLETSWTGREVDRILDEFLKNIYGEFRL